MELIKVGDYTYYIKNNTNIGVYKINDKEVYLIDTGNDSDAGKKIIKIIQENNLQIKGIINTHYHADHIGGNKVIQDRCNVPIYGFYLEKDFINNTFLEADFLYGGRAFKALYNKFLKAKDSHVDDIVPIDGLEYIELKGHSINMHGIKTSDNVYFLGDSLFSRETISKYHIFYIYDVKEFLNTLDILETLDGKFYIPSHEEGLDDIHDLIKLNRNKVKEIIDTIVSIIDKGITFEELLKEIFRHYNLIMNLNQYVLVGSTLKSYLSYLIDEDLICYSIKDNKLYYEKK